MADTQPDATLKGISSLHGHFFQQGRHFDVSVRSMDLVLAMV